MATYLEAIVAYHRRRAADRGSASRAGLDAAVAAAPPARPFAAALQAPGMSVIAEIKRRSPSKGDLALDLDPAELATCYEAGGAACLSVLTDEPHFAGSPADLESARAACALPVLRKDFTVCTADVLEARAMGADAVLLIVAALEPSEVAEYRSVAADLGMAAVVEVHDEAELDVALGAGAGVVGVNQRDLRSFEIDRHRAERVAAAIPAGIVRVAESGIRDRADVARLEDAGFDAVLVGETLVRSADPTAELTRLRGPEEDATCS